MDQNEKITRRAALEWIAGMFEEPPEAVKEDTPRDVIKAWDSLGVLTLMAELDERFGILLSEEELPALGSVGDILEILNKNGCLEEGVAD